MAGNILYKLSLDATPFEKGLNQAARKMDAFGRQMQGFGKSLSTYVTAPIAAMGAVAMKSWDAQAKALAQVEQGLRTTGGAAGYTANELGKMAEKLQSKTLFGDEKILQDVTAQLLTFTNVAGREFDRAQQAALDLATRLDGDLKGAAIMVGKALNDPIRGLTAMRRVGVAFTDSQQEMIKGLVASGKQMEAQRLILAELERQYGGSAEAAAKVGMGPLQQLANAVDDLGEEFGKILTEMIGPLTEKLRSLTTVVAGLSDETKKNIVHWGLIAAAAGPVVYGFGKVISFGGTLVALIGKIGAAFKWLSASFLANPIVIAIALIVAALAGFALYIKTFVDNWKAYTGYLAYAWDKVALKFAEGKNFMITVFQNLLNGVIGMLNKLLNVVGLKGIKAIDWSGAIDKNSEAIARLKADIAGNPFKDIDNSRVTWDKLKETATNTMESIKNVFKRNMNEVAASSEETAGVVSSNMQVIAGGGGGSGVSAGGSSGTSARTSASAPGMMSSMSPTSLGSLDTKTLGEKFKNVGDEIKTVAIDVSQTVQNGLGGMFDAFSEGIGSMIAGTGDVRNLFKGLLSATMDFVGQFGKALMLSGLGGIAFKKLIANPALAVGAGIALMALAATVKAIMSKGPAGSSSSGGSVSSGPSISSAPKFATGGIISGPTLAMVGDNINAHRDPEIVSPLSKLQQMLNINQGMPARIELYASGDSLQAVLDTRNRKLNRLR
jgi:hypothetical protein